MAGVAVLMAITRLRRRAYAPGDRLRTRSEPLDPPLRPNSGGIVPAATVDRLAEQVGLTGVSQILLEQIDHEAAPVRDPVRITLVDFDVEPTVCAQGGPGLPGLLGLTKPERIQLVRVVADRRDPAPVVVPDPIALVPRWTERAPAARAVKPASTNARCLIRPARVMVDGGCRRRNCSAVSSAVFQANCRRTRSIAKPRVSASPPVRHSSSGRSCHLIPHLQIVDLATSGPGESVMHPGARPGASGKIIRGQIADDQRHGDVGHGQHPDRVDRSRRTMCDPERPISGGQRACARIPAPSR